MCSTTPEIEPIPFISRAAKAHLFGSASRVEQSSSPAEHKAEPLRDDVPAFVLDLIDRAGALGLASVRKAIIGAFDALAAGIGAGSVEDSMATGSAGPILAATDAWETFASKLLEPFEAESALANVMAFAAAESLATLPVDVVGLDMGAVNDQAVAWLEREGAKLVTVVSNNTRAAINQLVQDAFAGSDSVQSAAAKILRVKGFGLTRPQAISYEKWVAGLLDPDGPGAGLSERKIRQLMRQKYQKMLKHRAGVVADTETKNAGNASQGQLWREAVAQEKLDPAVYVMEWVTRVVGACPRCEALDGTTAEIVGGQFESRLVESGSFAGQVIIIGSPTVHPKCQCTRRIINRADALDALPAA